MQGKDMPEQGGEVTVYVGIDVSKKSLDVCLHPLAASPGPDGSRRQQQAGAQAAQARVCAARRGPHCHRSPRLNTVLASGIDAGAARCMTPVSPSLWSIPGAHASSPTPWGSWPSLSPTRSGNRQDRRSHAGAVRRKPQSEGHAVAGQVIDRPAGTGQNPTWAWQAAVDERTALSNRLGAAETAFLRRELKRRLKAIGGHIERLEAICRRLADSDASLARRFEILSSIEGVGDVVGAMLVACLAELGSLDGKAIAALAGVAPMNRDASRALARCEASVTSRAVAAMCANPCTWRRCRPSAAIRL